MKKEPAKLKAIQRVSVTEAVVDSLKELIESGFYKPGDKLPTEASLCKQLEVSRTSVREASRVLQALGCIEIIPGKGSFVSKEYNTAHKNDYWYDAEDAKFLDFMEVRMAIETLAVKLAVKRSTTSQVQSLEKIHASFVNATKKQDVLQLIMLDEKFHTKIIEITKNPLLININEELIVSFREYRSSSFLDVSVFKNAIEPHSRILDCFKTKDSNKAVEEMNRHLEITKIDMKDILQKNKIQ